MKYFKEHKKTLLSVAIILGTIVLTSMSASLIQSDAGRVQVTDIRLGTNTGTLAADPAVAVKGKVVSGILFKPKEATPTNKLPAIVLTHGYLNNRELQLQNAVELARRGFVVITVDREGHGNYNNSGVQNATMASAGVYDSAKYLYNLPYVDQTKIGISGHSMGGYATAITLTDDSVTINGANRAAGKGLGIVSAGLMQGWDGFYGADATVDVGILKAKDDEFFFKSKTLANVATTSRQYLTSVKAAAFVGMDTTGLTEINVVNGGKYIGGVLTSVADGTEATGAFRAIYQADEIHPLNHFSIESAAYVTNFFYTAFGTPTGHAFIASAQETWWIKEIFTGIGLLAFLALILPLAELFLSIPLFHSLKKKHHEVPEETAKDSVDKRPELKNVQSHIILWVSAIACTMFAAVMVEQAKTYGLIWFPLTPKFPQDQTNWVAAWAAICGVFTIAMVTLGYISNSIINHFVYKEKAKEHTHNPFLVAKIGSAKNFFKTLLLATMIVGSLYTVLYLNWGVFMTDFRIWTLAFKVFDVPMMLPTMIRYAFIFAVWWVLSAIASETYNFKNLPEWASLAINAFFAVAGITLFVIIQYATFRSTGVLWKPTMNLAYIALFPLIPVFIFGVLISRFLTKKTGNIWLGGLVNTLLWTIFTVAGGAASFAYIFG